MWVLHVLQNCAFIIIIMAWSFFEKDKDKSCNAQDRRSGTKTDGFFETYRTSIMTHVKHIFETKSYM